MLMRYNILAYTSMRHAENGASINVLSEENEMQIVKFVWRFVDSVFVYVIYVSIKNTIYHELMSTIYKCEMRI